MTMDLVETLRVIREARGDAVVITTMGPAREWMALGEVHPLDFVFVPSTMGQATALGLGLALARPQRRVITCVGEGSLLMNLGSVVSIAAQAPENLVVLLFDNGVYEVTGGQQTPASDLGLDYAAIARACGIEHALTYDDDHQWRADAARVLGERGPTFVCLDVAPVPGAVGPRSPGPTSRRAEEFMRALDEQP